MGKINVYVKQYAKICDDLGIPYQFYGKSKTWLILTKKNGQKAFIFKSGTPLNQHNANRISRNKQMTVSLLKRAGIPVPEQYKVENTAQCLEIFNRLNSIVIKPRDSKGGNGITILPTADELERAFKEAAHFSKTVLVEKFLPGTNYRFLVLDNRVLSVILRKPPFIVGNGKSTVENLILELNKQNVANHIPEVKFGFQTERVIKSQGFSYTDVVPEGKMVFVRLTANLSKGGTTEDVSDKVPETHKQVAIKAAQALGLRFAGVDIICDDLLCADSTSYVIEINTSPGLKMHYYEEQGRKLNIAADIIQAIYNS